MAEQKDTITEILFGLNKNILNEQVSNKLIDILVKDVANLKKRNDILYSILPPQQKYQLMIDEPDIDKIKADETFVRNKLDTYKQHLLYNDDIKTEQVWEEYKDELQKLGVYDDMISLIK
jgi:hypothetical protein